jgi:hypothetical protein
VFQFLAEAQHVLLAYGHICTEQSHCLIACTSNVVNVCSCIINAIVSDMKFSPLLQEKGSPLPKFGEWDVNDPASAERFTVIFNKARDEKKTGGNSQGQDMPTKTSQASGQGLYAAKGNGSVSTVSFSFGCPNSHRLCTSFHDQVIVSDGLE